MNNEEKLLTIQQFADAVGKKKQTIYQQLHTSLKDFAVDLNGQKFIKADAVNYYSQLRSITKSSKVNDHILDNKENTKSDDKVVERKGKSMTAEDIVNYSQLLDSYKEQIDQLKERADDLKTQLSIKDNQIEKLQTLLDQEQQLHKQTKDQYQLLLVDKEEPPEHLQEELTAKDNMLTEQAEQIEKLKAELIEEKSKGFFKRFFKK